ncbi:MAG: DUF4190 domain-containing protein [Planctomycetaceae bacterium]|jgi:hypothetical protein|nr:DUF4190 domain-containing protein [Planctomycetaceae bacterium]MBT4726308.1 DUF4190 domain-containing protein [Planctomycetaceae bacterium]MBT4844968.1 DUF4190 domain-containing protein [Planctomycetaceae bacterium]MBT5123548.1 DUF4190 domain-containing protein [Planctomycetaceae bacterium]MBT5599357.1 DUF4190 domain-containing protein [Planctomycetaceae bacterium]
MSHIPPQNPYQQPDTYTIPQALVGSRKDQALAIVALVTGILSVTVGCICFSFLPLALTAIVTGVLGMRKVSQGTGEGYGMALTGVILGSLTMLTYAVGFAYIYFSAQSANNY